MKLHFTYKNHRGEVSQRIAVSQSTRFAATEYHTTPQWIMRAWDCHKEAIRDFAMNDMSDVKPHPTFAMISFDTVEAMTSIARELNRLCGEIGAGPVDEISARISELRGKLKVYSKKDSEGPIDLYFPAHINMELREVLRAPPWRVATLAQALRAAGHSIPKRFEDETAAVKFMLIRFVLMYGQTWHKEFGTFLGGQANDAMRDAHAIIEGHEKDYAEIDNQKDAQILRGAGYVSTEDVHRAAEATKDVD